MVWSRSITDNRNPGTPEWLPQFRDGRLVRFMNQNGPTVSADAPWGPLRVVYLQYASDPIVLFRYRDFYRQPDWMNTPRGPDVSSDLRWFPVVTVLQLAVDMAVAAGTSMGYGHAYAPEHYIDAWVAVTGIATWTPAALTQLKQHLGEAARQPPRDSSEAPFDNRGGCFSPVFCLDIGGRRRYGTRSQGTSPVVILFGAIMLMMSPDIRQGCGQATSNTDVLARFRRHPRRRSAPECVASLYK